VIKGVEPSLGCPMPNIRELLEKHFICIGNYRIGKDIPQDIWILIEDV
jgi:hypothetical protein